MSGLKVFKRDKITLERGSTADGHVEFQRAVGPETTNSELGGGMEFAEDTSFDWTLTYDEIVFVVEGTLRLTTDDETVEAKAGDIVWIPEGTQLRYEFIGPTRVFYAVHPASKVPWENLLDGA